MADVAECIEKLVVAGKVSRAIADEAMEMFKRSKGEYSQTTGPASADAMAALQAAKQLRDTAAKNQIKIASTVKAWHDVETRLKDDPRGPNAAMAGMLSKDTRREDNRLNALRESDPTHPIFTGPNADYKYQVIAREMYTRLGKEMESFKSGLLKGKDVAIKSARNFIYERFGVDSGDAAAKAVSDSFGKVIDAGANRATAAGKIFEPREDWRVFQPWRSSRLGKLTEGEFVKDFRAEMDAGGLKLWDKETNSYGTADRYDYILKKAYRDIKVEGGDSTPFSKQMRTFEFQDGKGGADSWLKLQGKYGVGNEIMSAVTNHVDHMSRDIALHETFGGSPDAVFAAGMKLVRENPTKIAPGLGWLDSEHTLTNTYNIISGKGHPVANETTARFMSGVRNIVGAASLRNLPITIIPSDTAMTFMAANHLGMSGFNVLSHVFDGAMTKDVARHLQISSHGYMDYINNFIRQYDDQLNVSGIASKFPRTIVKATGADLWTTNGRLGWQVSMLNQIAEMGGQSFDKLDPKFRKSFLEAYGFTAADWDKIRATPTFDAGNNARYLDPTQIEKPLSERLLMAIKEQGSYAFHEPDARTQAIMTQGVKRGSASGEAWLSMGQYKQFAMERMTTHLTRIMVDGTMAERVQRGLAFTILSTLAGATSLQTAAVLAGKDPLNMRDPKFWIGAFAKGGAGAVYGDLLANVLEGSRGGVSIAAQMAGPIPGLIGDAVTVASSPVRSAMHDNGKPVKDTFAHEAFGVGRRWTPNTWYTKLAVDRMLWDKLQVLADPGYRQSFNRAAQNAKKQGAGYWWGSGDSGPQRTPDLGTAIAPRH